MKRIIPDISWKKILKYIAPAEKFGRKINFTFQL